MEKTKLEINYIKHKIITAKLDEYKQKTLFKWLFLSKPVSNMKKTTIKKNTSGEIINSFSALEKCQYYFFDNKQEYTEKGILLCAIYKKKTPSTQTEIREYIASHTSIDTRERKMEYYKEVLFVLSLAQEKKNLEKILFYENIIDAKNNDILLFKNVEKKTFGHSKKHKTKNKKFIKKSHSSRMCYKWTQPTSLCYWIRQKIPGFCGRNKKIFRKKNHTRLCKKLSQFENLLRTTLCSFFWETKLCANNTAYWGTMQKSLLRRQQVAKQL